MLRYGLLAIALILWYSLLWDPLAAKLADIDMRIETQEARIDQLNRELRRYRGVDQRLKQAEQQRSQAIGMLVPGNVPQLVASNLQDMLLKKASEAGLEVVTYKTAPVRKWREYQLAVATFTVKASTRKLVHFLRLLQEERMIFRTHSINVVKVQGRDQHLRVSLEVEALVIQEAGAG